MNPPNPPNPPITPLLYQHLAYVAAGFLYNVVSMIRCFYDLSPLSISDPISGAILMLLLAAVIALGFRGYFKIYSWLTALLMLLPVLSVYLHGRAFLDGSWSLNYASFLAWALALLINLFGVVVVYRGLLRLWFARRDANNASC